MANRCYLSCSDHDGIYPSFSLPDFNTEVQWVVHGAGCLPLIWLPMFTDGDLVSKEFSAEGQTFTETAPVVSRMLGVERLLSLRGFLNKLFRENGGLDHHIDVFAEFIKSMDGEYVTIELQEISWLYQAGEFQPLLRRCLTNMAAQSTEAKDALITLSTVIDGRRFLTLEETEDGNYEDEDMWNYFRIMGEPYIRNVPWS